MIYGFDGAYSKSCLTQETCRSGTKVRGVKKINKKSNVNIADNSKKAGCEDEGKHSLSLPLEYKESQAAATKAATNCHLSFEHFVIQVENDGTHSGEF